MPTFLVIKDSTGYVFGSYTTDGWRTMSSFYGSGETLVFQLQVGCEMIQPGDDCSGIREHMHINAAYIS
jgi:hypothetical protein